MYSALFVHSWGRLFLVVVLSLSFCFISARDLKAQSSSNDLGNGGRHTIHGRLYAANGRRSQVSGLKIRLTASSAGDIFIITDETGTFTFRSVNAGSYLIIVEGGGIFEDTTERVYIDDPGSSSIRSPIRIREAPRYVNVQIYLRTAAGATSTTAPGILHVKWAKVPKAAIEHYESGLKLIRDGNDQGAGAEFSRAVEISPSFAPAHTELGRIAQRAGDLDASAAHLRTAIRYDDADFDAHLNLGIAMLNLKKYDLAEPELVKAAYLDRTAVTPHYYLGILFVLKNDLDVAQKAFETAKELKGGRSLPAIHKYLGRIYMRKDMEKEAVHELETYLKLSPKAQDAEKVKKDISDMKAKQIKNAFV